MKLTTTLISAIKNVVGLKMEGCRQMGIERRKRGRKWKKNDRLKVKMRNNQKQRATLKRGLED